MNLYLIYHGLYRRNRENMVKVMFAEVAHAYRTNLSVVIKLLERTPCVGNLLFPYFPCRLRTRPVNEKQVEIVESRHTKTLVICRKSGLIPLFVVCKLCCDEYVASCDAAFSHGFAYRLLVAVALGGVNVSVAAFKRIFHGVYRSISVGRAPGPESDGGDRHSV